MVIKNKFGQKGQARLQSLACSNSGQALLIVVLVMVVGLTIGLSIVSKSITNVRTTTEEANSAQALAAAEAGVAQAIQTNQGVPIGSDITYGNNASFTSSIAQTAGQTTVLLNDGTIVPKDEGADLWFVPHDPTSGLPDYSFNSGNGWPGTSINIYFGDSAVSCDQAALEVLIIKAPVAAPTSLRYALDPCGGRGNNFTNPTSGSYSIGGKNFYYTFNLNPSGGLIARIVPIYKNTLVAVKDTNIPPVAGGFPSQGAVITSTGKAKDTTIQRKLNVFQGFSYLPIEYVSYGIVVHK